MPVQTRSMLKNMLNDEVTKVTPVKTHSIKMTPNAPKKQKLNNNEKYLNYSEYNYPTLQHSLCSSSLVNDNNITDVKHFMPTHQVNQFEFNNYIRKIVDKMMECEHNNEKFEYYLEFCKFNINHLKRISEISTMSTNFNIYVEQLYSKCKTFNVAIKKGQYDKLTYGLVMECSQCNLHLENICEQLLSTF
jgi:hypothetical protein